MKDFSTFTTEYREQMLKNDTKDNSDAANRHEFYSEVTTAGKPRYLEIEKTGIKMPQELHQAIIAGKIADAWRAFALNPILQREAVEEEDAAGLQPGA